MGRNGMQRFMARKALRTLSVRWVCSLGVSFSASSTFTVLKRTLGMEEAQPLGPFRYFRLELRHKPFFELTSHFFGRRCLHRLWLPRTRL